MKDDESLMDRFNSSATKQITRMQYTAVGSQTISTSTPTNTSNIEEVVLKLPDVFSYIPSRYGSLKDRLEFKSIASGNLKRIISDKDVKQSPYLPGDS